MEPTACALDGCLMCESLIDTRTADFRDFTFGELIFIAFFGAAFFAAFFGAFLAAARLRRAAVAPFNWLSVLQTATTSDALDRTTLQ